MKRPWPVGVMGEAVDQRAGEAFGAEHFGPFGKRQRQEMLRGEEVVQRVRLSSPRSAQVAAFAVANLTRCLMSVPFECLCPLQASFLGFGSAM
jgi:hypothetical protein